VNDWVSLAHPSAYRLLLDVSSPEFQGAQPLEVDAFKAWQAECTERGKAGLWTSWLPKCVEVFRRLLPIFINGNSDAYYSSIATLQVCPAKQQGTLHDVGCLTWSSQGWAVNFSSVHVSPA